MTQDIWKRIEKYILIDLLCVITSHTITQPDHTTCTVWALHKPAVRWQDGCFIVILQMKTFHLCRTDCANIILSAFPPIYHSSPWWSSPLPSPWWLPHLQEQYFNGPLCTWLLSQTSNLVWNGTFLEQKHFSRPQLRRLRMIRTSHVHVK